MSGSVTYASTETVMMPAACASSSAGFSADGSFGLKTIASTPCEIRSRRSASWPAASVFRWMTVIVRHLAGGERLGLGRADLLLAEAVADAVAVRIADRVHLRLARTGSPGRGRPGIAVRARGHHDRNRGQCDEPACPDLPHGRFSFVDRPHPVWVALIVSPLCPVPRRCVTHLLVVNSRARRPSRWPATRCRPPGGRGSHRGSASSESPRSWSPRGS